MQRQVVLPQHRQHVHALLVRRTEHLDDFAFGIGVARHPFAQFDHDLVADVGRPADVARRRHVDVVRHARVIGNDVKKLPAALQGADDLRPAPFQDADDRAGFLGRAFRAQAPRADVAAHQHAVFVQRGGRGVLRDHDFLQGRVVRLQKSLALAVDPDAAGNEVRLAGQDVAVALGAGDAARAFQSAQDALQFLLAVRRPAQVPEQFGDIGGHVAVLAEQS